MASKEFKVIDKTGLEPLWDKVNELHTTVQTCFNQYEETQIDDKYFTLTRVNGTSVNNSQISEQFKLVVEAQDAEIEKIKEKVGL